MGQLIDKIIQSKYKSISIIGMAKNAGKTETLNHIIDKIENRGLSMSILSYGRDGEETDAVTMKEKPKIFIPPESYFVTAAKAYAKSDIKAVLIKSTDIKTLLGNVNIYKSSKTGDFVELVGVNTVKQVKKIKNFLSDKTDLFLLDGAVDRKSSAVPEISEVFILATGAVIGSSEEEVVEKTLTAVEKLSLKKTKDKLLINKLKSELIHNEKKISDLVIYEDDQLEILKSEISFNNYHKIKNKAAEKEIRTVFLNGALVNSFISICKPFIGLTGSEIVVRDGTKIFLDFHNMNVLKKYEIKLSSLVNMQLLGITVNPTAPDDRYLDAKLIIKSLKRKLNEDAVVLNIRSEY